MRNLVADALAEGLNPRAPEETGMTEDTETIPLDCLLLLSLESRAGRIADFAERFALAAERQSVALEKIAETFAAVTGVGQRFHLPDASDSGSLTTRPVRYVRTGDGRRNFGTDHTGDDDED